MADEVTLTNFGRRILRCPSLISPLGVDERTLIEQLQGLGSYGDYQREIQALVQAGYLIQDSLTRKYKRSRISGERV